MAIYDLGTASIAANGEVTGVGTTWKSPLTLIRVGATIVFKTEPVQIYTISEIISDTRINVYNPNSETVPAGTGYAILAHDGITVQGLAQDVAETLRYYQSRETEVADAVDAFNNFDANDFDSKVTQVNDQYGDVISIGSQVAADAIQVSSDKDSASASAISASNDKDAAAASAQEAADYAASLDTENLLRKDLALSDLTNKPLARQNLDVYSKGESPFIPVNESTSESIQDSINNGSNSKRRVFLSGEISQPSQLSVPYASKIFIDGDITSTLMGTGDGGPSSYLMNVSSNSIIDGGIITNTRLCGVATSRSSSNVKIRNVTAEGSVLPSTPFAYAFDFRQSTDLQLCDCTLSKYSGALSMIGCSNVKITGNTVYDMFYHQANDAGGYGFVFGASSNVIISNNYFKASDGDNGRHAVYLATQGGDGNSDVIISNNVFDWSGKTDSFRGAAVNVRKSVRTIISNNVFNGTSLTGNLDSGTITNCDVIGNDIRVTIYPGQTTAYGLNLGDSVGEYIVDGGNVTGNRLVMLNKDPTVSAVAYGFNVTGLNRNFSGNSVEVPVSGYPFRVSAGASNIVISNNIDKSTSSGGQAFILFDGPCSNITVLGNKTKRNMFRNVTNVTDLTVDFPRYLQVASVSGSVTNVDPDTMIKSVSLNANSMIIELNDHVTQRAADTMQVERTLNQNPPLIPVIADRSNKTITVRFYSVNTTQVLVPPDTQSVAVRLISSC